MIRIAVCDDELHMVRQMEAYLREYPAEISVEIFLSGEELLEGGGSYEIILLDIDMKGKNGIETAKEIRKRDKQVKIIYVTNYSDYTAFAFSVHAFAYLLKPVTKEALFDQLGEALLYMKAPGEEMMEFTAEEGIIRIESSKILCFEYADRKISLRTKDQRYTLRRRITDLAEELKDRDFFMPHKSFVVNLYAVKKIEGYDIILTDGSKIPLSQKKSAAFRRALNCYLSKRGGMRL